MPQLSLLAGYENAQPLPTDFNEDGKSLRNIPAPESEAYQKFPSPIKQDKNGFDFHIYYMQTVEAESQYAQQLHERIRREFPELRIYRLWDRPIGKVQHAWSITRLKRTTGPHPTAMFEVNTFTPHQTGALFSWLAVRRGPLS